MIIEQMILALMLGMIIVVGSYLFFRKIRANVLQEARTKAYEMTEQMIVEHTHKIDVRKLEEELEQN